MPIYRNDVEPGILFHQMFFVLGGLFLILLGMSIFYTVAFWARRGRRVEGEVIGVRSCGVQFHSVYRYAPPAGGFREATSVQGSSSLKGRGTVVALMLLGTTLLRVGLLASGGSVDVGQAKPAKSYSGYVKTKLNYTAKS